MKMHGISLIAFFCFVFFGWVEKFFLTCPQVLLFVRNEEQGRPSLPRLVKSASSYSAVSSLCASAALAWRCNQRVNIKEGYFEHFSWVTFIESTILGTFRSALSHFWSSFSHPRLGDVIRGKYEGGYTTQTLGGFFSCRHQRHVGSTSLRRSPGNTEQHLLLHCPSPPFFRSQVCVGNPKLQLDQVTRWASSV